MRDVSIIGTGITKFGELWDKSLRELGLMAGLEAIQDAGISSSDIDALYVGNMAAGSLVQQEHVSALIADYCAMAGAHVPSTRIEGASASGGLALRQAYMAVAGGFIDVAVVGGAEKMTDVSDSESAHTLSMGADEEWESQQGATFASLHAMMAQAHMTEFGTTREMLSAVASKNHGHAALNPQAQFPFPIKPEAVSSSGLVSDPLRMLDCAPQSDGGAWVPVPRVRKSECGVKAERGTRLHYRRYLYRSSASRPTASSPCRPAYLAIDEAEYAYCYIDPLAAAAWTPS